MILSFYLENLPVDIQHVDGDLHVFGDALSAFLELPLLQRDVKVIPHLSCRKRRGGTTAIDYAWRRDLLTTSRLLGNGLCCDASEAAAIAAAFTLAEFTFRL